MARCLLSFDGMKSLALGACLLSSCWKQHECLLSRTDKYEPRTASTGNRPAAATRGVLSPRAWCGFRAAPLVGVSASAKHTAGAVALLAKGARLSSQAWRCMGEHLSGHALGPAYLHIHASKMEARNSP